MDTMYNNKTMVVIYCFKRKTVVYEVKKPTMSIIIITTKVMIQLLRNSIVLVSNSICLHCVEIMTYSV